MRITSIVQRILEDEQSRAAAYAREATPQDLEAGSYFFRDLAERAPSVAPRCNIPPEVSLKHYLLAAPAVGVLDVRPMTHHEFSDCHGFTVNQVAKLVDNGLLVLNLHARRPNAWLGARDMRPLLERTRFCNGVRVDAYLSLRAPDYSDSVERNISMLRSHCDGLVEAEATLYPLEWRVTPATDLPRALAYRLAYVQAFDPEAAQFLTDLILARQHRDFIEQLDFHKKKCRPDITAATGGDYYLGASEIHSRPACKPFAGEVARQGVGASSPEARAMMSEAVEYLLLVLGQLQPHRFTRDPNGDVLIGFLLSEEARALRDRVGVFLRELVKLAESDGLTAAAVSDFEKLVKEYRSRLPLAVATAGVMTTVAFGTVGDLLGGTPLAVLLGGLSVLVSAAASNQQLAPQVHRLANRALGRLIKHPVGVVAYVDAIKEWRAGP